MWQDVGADAVSDDEVNEEGDFVAPRPCWRNNHPIIRDFFHVPDILHFARRFQEDGCKHRMPGQLPGIRIHSDRVDIKALPAKGLPENFYDEKWLRDYRKRDPLRYADLNVADPIDMRLLRFSSRVYRYVGSLVTG